MFSVNSQVFLFSGWNQLILQGVSHSSVKFLSFQSPATQWASRMTKIFMGVLRTAIPNACLSEWYAWTTQMIDQMTDGVWWFQ